MFCDFLLANWTKRSKRGLEEKRFIRMHVNTSKQMVVNQRMVPVSEAEQVRDTAWYAHLGNIIHQIYQYALGSLMYTDANGVGPTTPRIDGAKISEEAWMAIAGRGSQWIPTLPYGGG